MNTLGDQSRMFIVALKEAISKLEVTDHGNSVYFNSSTGVEKSGQMTNPLRQPKAKYTPIVDNKPGKATTNMEEAIFTALQAALMAGLTEYFSAMKS